MTVTQLPSTSRHGPKSVLIVMNADEADLLADMMALVVNQCVDHEERDTEPLAAHHTGKLIAELTDKILIDRIHQLSDHLLNELLK
jgi:hypothetical protein